MSSFSSKILQPPCSADFSAVGGRCSAGGCREGGPVFVFAPATSCLPCTWQSGAPPVLRGREVFAVLTLEHIGGALQGALFTWCVGMVSSWCLAV